MNRCSEQSYYKHLFLAICLLIFAGSNAWAEPIQPLPVQSIPIQANPLPTNIQQKTQLPSVPSVTHREQKKVLTPAIKDHPSEAGRSSIEQYVSGKIPQKVSTNLKQFGYDLFKRPSSTFAPVEKVPVGPNYVIGPGDEVRITVWGKVTGKWNVVVNRDGNIALPKIGIIGVTGLTFKEIKTLLYRELSQYYSGFEMDVSMGRLRTIQVYVVGNARSSGAYTISSLSTLVNALFAAGGPAKTGTMRDIQVKRNGKTIMHFDVYDFLLKGDKTKDIRLMPEDVIFIPPVGEHASIAGSVTTPAIYEIKGEMSVADLIEIAGGLSDFAFNGRLQVERIAENSRQIVFESDLSHVATIKLNGGDVVKIFPVFEDRRTVRVAGAVNSEGEYGFSPGMTVRDLVSLGGGLRYYAFDEVAELTRVLVTNKGPVTKKIIVNLREALQGKTASNLPLMHNDYLFIRAVPEWKLYRVVNIDGEVKFPGAYTIGKDEPLSSLIERAGGFTEDAYLEGSVFIRESIRKQQQKTINEMVDRLERELMGERAAKSSTALTPDDAKIQSLETEQKRKFVESLRAVKAKGRLVIKLLPLDKLKGTSYDIQLEEGDTLHIAKDPMIVNVAGSVFNQSAFVYDRGNSISDYIKMAGGYTDNADKKKVYILKADGSAVKPGKGLLGIRWNSNKHKWNTGNSNLESGDIIIVPEKLERVAWLKQVKDVTQILFQIAVSAAVVLTF